jgi:hypothetical protein
MSYLMTQSILSSWKYQAQEFEDFENADGEITKSADEQRDAARAEFISALRRERTPTTEAQQRGLDFEELVTRIASGESYKHNEIEAVPYNTPASDESLYSDIEPFSERVIFDNPAWGKWEQVAQEISAIVKDAQFQVVAQSSVIIDGIEYLLYGRLDALKAGVIYDIKFTSKYAVGKYYGSAQHPMYLELVPEASEFVYLVSNGSRIWQERYKRGVDNISNIRDTIAEFTAYLRDAGLWELYAENWVSK